MDTKTQIFHHQTTSIRLCVSKAKAGKGLKDSIHNRHYAETLGDDERRRSVREHSGARSLPNTHLSVQGFPTTACSYVKYCSIFHDRIPGLDKGSSCWGCRIYQPPVYDKTLRTNSADSAASPLHRARSNRIHWDSTTLHADCLGFQFYPCLLRLFQEEVLGSLTKLRRNRCWLLRIVPLTCLCRSPLSERTWYHCY